MNRSYRLVWNAVQHRYVAAPETARGRGKSTRGQCVATAVVAAMAFTAHAAPTGGSVSAGTGSISQQGSTTTVNQTSPKLAVNWTSFGIAAGESVNFVQPNASSVALNRVLGSDPSQIYGQLNANGQVFLLNPNGILFGKNAQVNVGGLVASTLQLSDADFLAGKHRFSGSGGSVTNLGSIEAAPGGYIAFLGARVSNQGVVQAQLGNVTLAAGRQVTLDFAGDKLINVQVEQGALDALAENRQLIQADGGSVLLTARAADRLASAVVNNTGVIQARTLQNRGGTIRLMGDMEVGHAQVDGMLDASAPNGGDGGFVETSAAHVHIADSTRVTTYAPSGRTGTWLIDPSDYTVAASEGDITGATLSSNLATTSMTLQSSRGATAGSGDVNVNDTVSWSADTTLTLLASNNVNVNAPITASGAGAGITISPNTANGSEAASGSGTFNLGREGVINLPNVSPSSTTALVIGGAPYTVINSLGTPGDTSGTTLQGIDMTSGHYALGSDIEAAATSGWNAGEGFMPITLAGSPALVFDGLGHAIKNLTINRPSTANVGLFGILNVDSIVRNVGLLGGTVTGGIYVGGLAGASVGTVSHSYSTSSVVGIGGSAVGGLIGGVAGGVISDSHSTGSVTSSAADWVGGLTGVVLAGGKIINSFATGSVKGRNRTGGLVGYLSNSTIKNSYATGDVGGGHRVGGLVGEVGYAAISKSYATGAVSATTEVGGLIGTITGSTVSESYSYGNVTGSSSTGGSIGRSGTSTFNDVYWGGTSGGPWGDIGANFGGNSGSPRLLSPDQMLCQLCGFDNWDFTNTWVIYQGRTTPLLRAFMTPLTVASNNAAKTYDGLAYSGGNGVTYSSATNANLLGAVSYRGSSQGAINAGSYAITPSGLYSNQQGYIISYTPSTLTIDAAALTVTANDAIKTYGQIPTLTFTASALQNNETIGSVTLTSAGTAATANVGAYTITPSKATGGTFNPSNYQISYVNGSLKVDPATLTITADSASRIYGAANPMLTGAVSGFVNTDTLANATTGTLAFTTAATNASGIGRYAITGSGLVANNGNYVFVQAPGNADALSVTSSLAFEAALSDVQASRTFTASSNPRLLDSQASGAGVSLRSMDAWGVDLDASRARQAGEQGAMQPDVKRKTSVKGMPLTILQGGISLPEGVSVPR